jgi:hypothetical protein
MISNFKYTKTFVVVALLFIIVFILDALAHADENQRINQRLNELNYHLISAKTIKVGDIVLTVGQHFLTGQYYQKYERPILVLLKVKCIPTGKIYEANIELIQERDKWGKWVTLGISDDYFPECKSAKQIRIEKKRQKDAEKAAEEKRKAAQDIMEREREAEARAEESILKRFIQKADGTVSDTTTGLMWAMEGFKQDKDLGQRNKDDMQRILMFWEAWEYIKRYRGGGYKDWRMPTPDELETLYEYHRFLDGKKIRPKLLIGTRFLWAAQPIGNVKSEWERFLSSEREKVDMFICDFSTHRTERSPLYGWLGARTSCEKENDDRMHYGTLPVRFDK